MVRFILIVNCALPAFHFFHAVSRLFHLHLRRFQGFQSTTVDGHQWRSLCHDWESWMIWVHKSPQGMAVGSGYCTWLIYSLYFRGMAGLCTLCGWIVEWLHFESSPHGICGTSKRKEHIPNNWSRAVSIAHAEQMSCKVNDLQSSKEKVHRLSCCRGCGAKASRWGSRCDGFLQLRRAPWLQHLQLPANSSRLRSWFTKNHTMYRKTPPPTAGLSGKMWGWTVSNFLLVRFPLDPSLLEMSVGIPAGNLSPARGTKVSSRVAADGRRSCTWD